MATDGPHVGERNPPDRVKIPIFFGQFRVLTFVGYPGQQKARPLLDQHQPAANPLGGELRGVDRHVVLHVDQLRALRLGGGARLGAVAPLHAHGSLELRVGVIGVVGEIVELRLVHRFRVFPARDSCRRDR